MAEKSGNIADFLRNKRIHHKMLKQFLEQFLPVSHIDFSFVILNAPHVFQDATNGKTVIHYAVDRMDPDLIEVVLKEILHAVSVVRQNTSLQFCVYACKFAFTKLHYAPFVPCLSINTFSSALISFTTRKHHYQKLEDLSC